MKRSVFIHAALFILLLNAWGGRVQAQTDTLVFAPHWIPQAQFAGYYVALDQGFYSDAGLKVKIIHPSSDVSSFDYLKSGKAHLVSSFLLDGIKQRVQGVPLVNVGQFSQHSALMMVARTGKGIERPEDLEGKKLGIWSQGFDDIPLTFLKERKIEPVIVRILNTVNLFLMGGIDAMVVMHYNEYDQIINSGINEDELVPFFFANYGFDIPEDGIYCLETTRNTRPDEIARFVQATMKGWEYAAQHKEYCIDLVVEEMRKAHLPNNKAHQRWMLDRMLELIAPGDKQVEKGKLLESDFQRALQLIEKQSNADPSIMSVNYGTFHRP